jgi:Ca2+-dependent lipid-binding protein
LPHPAAAISIVAGKMLVYPNEFMLPLMPNFGLPPPPQGMLHIKVVKCTGLKGGIFDRMDPFVTLELRKGREAKTSTKTNEENPVWNEEFDLVVDEPVSERCCPLEAVLLSFHTGFFHGW